MQTTIREKVSDFKSENYSKMNFYNQRVKLVRSKYNTKMRLYNYLAPKFAKKMDMDLLDSATEEINDPNYDRPRPAEYVDPTEPNYIIKKFYERSINTIRVHNNYMYVDLMVVHKEPCLETIPELLRAIDTSLGIYLHAYDWVEIDGEEYAREVVFQVFTISPYLMDIIGILINKYGSKWILEDLNLKLDEDVIDKYYKPIHIKEITVKNADPDIEELLMIGCVELNPGPVKTITIPSYLLSKVEEGSKIVLTMHNQSIVEVLKHQFLQNDYQVQLRVDEDMATKIEKSIVKEAKHRLVANLPLDRLEETYSNHENFNPSARIVVRPIYKYFSEMGHDFPLTESEGALQKSGNFNFIPKNLIRIKIGDTWATHESINDNKCRYLVRSIAKQDMTKQQLVHYASLMTTTQMMTKDIENSYSQLICLFDMLFQNNVAILNKMLRKCVSPEEAWELLELLDFVLIPTQRLHFGSITEIVLNKSLITPEFAPTYQNLQELNQRMKPFDYEVGKYKVISAFRTCTTMASKLKAIVLKFDFQTTKQKIATTPRKETPQLNKTQEFVKKLVKKRLVVSDFVLAVSQILYDEDDVEFIKEIVQHYSERLFTYMPMDNLKKLFAKEVKGDKVDIDNMHNNDISYASMSDEFILARRMQLEYQVFLHDLGCEEYSNVFNTFENIRELYHFRRSKVEVVNDTLMQRLKKQFNEAKEFLANMSDTSKTMKEVNKMWEEKKDSITNILNYTESPLVKYALDMSDFSSFSSSLKAGKDIVNLLFGQMITKLGEYFGIEVEPYFPATTALLYYLIWKNTDNVALQYILLLDILGTIGIVDVALASLRTIGSVLKKLWDKVMPVVSDNEIEKILGEMAKETQNLTDQAKAGLDTVDDVTEENEDLSVWDKIVYAATSENVTLIGGIALAIGTAMKLATSDYKIGVVGKDVVSTMKNISIIGGGLAMIPKTYQLVLSLFKWIFDELKGQVCKEHHTKREISNRVGRWMSEVAPYLTESCIKCFSRSPGLCMNWLALDKEAQILRANTMKMPKDIRIEFAKVDKIFTSRSEKVHVAIVNMFPSAEIFHVQFTSAPGTGKTDLGQQVAQSLQKAQIKGHVNRAMTASDAIKYSLISEALSTNTEVLDEYCYNENLKFMDGYTGQSILYVDDMFVMKNTPGENVVQQMYICSGATVLANMADLNEKGRPIDSKIMISNTNNAFPKIDNMVTPEALWRRRVLVRVKFVKGLEDLLKKSEVDANTTIDKYCRENNLNRTLSEHLLHDILVPTNDQSVPLKMNGVELKNLTTPQLMKVLSGLFIKHMAMEWNRGVTKMPVAAKLQLYYDALMKANWSKKFDNSTESLMKNGAEILSDYYDKIGKAEIEVKLKELVQSNQITREQSKQLKEKYSLKTEKRKEYLREYAEGTNVDGLIRPVEISQKLTKHTLAEGKHEEKGYYYYLIESTADHVYEDVCIDWNKVVKTKISLEKVSDQNVEKYVFVSEVKLEPLDKRVVLGALLELDSVSSFHKDTFLAKKQRKSAELPLLSKFAQELKFQISRAGDFCAKASSWIYKKIIKRLGESLVNGIFTMVALIGLFYTASVVGYLFAPSEVSYNKNAPKTLIPGVSLKKGKVQEVSMDVSSAKNLTRSCFKASIGEASFQMLAYEGNVFVVPMHGMEKVKFPAKIQIADPTVTGEIKEYDLLREHYKPIPDTDYALLSLPKFRPAKCLRNKWITQIELESNEINIRNIEVSIVSIRERSYNPLTFESNNRQFEIQNRVETFVPLDVRANGRHNKTVLGCRAQVIPGDSGSLVVHHNNHLPSSVLGIVHQSGVAAGVAYVAVLSREDIDKVYKTFDFEHKIKVSLHEVEEVSAHRLKPIFKHNQILKESPYRNKSVDVALGFKRTPIATKFPVDVSPAIQTDSDSRIPSGARHFLEVSLNKSAGLNEAKYSESDAKFMAEYLRAIYLKYVPEVTTSRILTTAQAITGIRMLGSTSIDVTTSAGLPYCEEKGVIGKTPMISYNQEQKYWKIQERVYDDVNKFKESYLVGQVPRNAKLEFRKHELVGPNKIENPKTRTVGTGNFIQQIIYMEIFKDFHTQTKNVWMKGRTSPFAIGLNPEIHWNKVAEHLVWDDYVIDFDVKAWEEKMNQNIMTIATKVRLDIIRKSMLNQGLPWSKDYEKIALALVVDYIHTDVVFEDIMYTKTSGLLSGHPGTFMENSEVHEMILGIACKHILQKYAPHYATIPFIIENVKSVKAADDIVISISPLARPYITVDRLVQAYNDLGYEVTNPDKTPTVTAKELKQVQFLKNGFLCEDGYITMHPNESQVNQLLHWVRTNTKNSLSAQLMENFTNAMRFAFWRGEKEYNRVKDDLNEACAQTKIPFQWALTYDEMKNVVSYNIQTETNKFHSRSEADETDTVYQEPLDGDIYLK